MNRPFCTPKLTSFSFYRIQSMIFASLRSWLKWKRSCVVSERVRNEYVGVRGAFCSGRADSFLSWWDHARDRNICNECDVNEWCRMKIFDPTKMCRTASITTGRGGLWKHNTRTTTNAFSTTTANTTSARYGGSGRCAHDWHEREKISVMESMRSIRIDATAQYWKPEISDFSSTVLKYINNKYYSFAGA